MAKIIDATGARQDLDRVLASAKTAGIDPKALVGVAFIRLVNEPSLRKGWVAASAAAIDQYIVGLSDDDSALRGAMFVLGAIDGLDAISKAAEASAATAVVAKFEKLANAAHDPELAAGYRQLADDARAKVPGIATVMRSRAASMRTAAKAAGTPGLADELRAGAAALEAQAVALGADDPTSAGGQLAEILDACRRVLQEIAAELLSTAAAAGVEMPAFSMPVATTRPDLDPVDTVKSLRRTREDLAKRRRWLMDQVPPTGPVRIRPPGLEHVARERETALAAADRFDKLAGSVTDPTLADGYRALAAQKRAAADRHRHRHR